MGENDLHDIEDDDVRRNIAYVLRRFLRKRRGPDDAGFGARKIIEQLKISGVVWKKRPNNRAHFQPFGDGVDDDAER